MKVGRRGFLGALLVLPSMARLALPFLTERPNLLDCHGLRNLVDEGTFAQSVYGIDRSAARAKGARTAAGVTGADRSPRHLPA